MECREARKLIRKGVVAGAGPGRNPHLGFHLSGCSACRVYRERHPTNFERFASLPRFRPSTDNDLQTGGTPLRPTHTRLFRVVATAAILVCLFSGWYIGVPLARAWSNLTVITSLPTAQPSIDTEATPAALLLPTTAESTSSQPSPTAPIASSPSPVHTSTTSPSPTASATTTPSLIPTDTASPTATPSSTPTNTATATTSSPTNTVSPTTSPPTSTATTIAPPAPTSSPAVAPELAASSTDAKTILFLGIDSRAGEGTRGRSDAIMLVHADPAAQRVSMLSLPRDLWVSIPGVGEGKLNSAYFIGEQRQNGAGLAKETVSQALGIDVDHVVVADFVGFKSLIDTLGGVPVDVPRELYDARFPTEDYGYTVARFTPGTEVMNGERALTYSRIRHPDSDFARMRRQQSVLVGIARKLRERGALANLHEADKITAALIPFVRTDLPPSLALNLLWSVRTVEPAAVNRLTADSSIVGEANIGGAYALVADPGVLHALGTQLIAGP